MTNHSIYPEIKAAVADALGLDDDEVTPEATLFGDLGAESIDLLDILFRIERQLGLKVEPSALADYIQGGIPDDEFGDEDGIITAAGLAQLAKVMPQVDAAAMAGKLEAEQVMNLFSVDNLVGVVQACGAAAAVAS